jgi:integrase/recombinase XerD
MGNLNDPQEFQRKLQRYETKLDESDAVAAADREAIHAYKRTKRGGVSLGTLTTYLRRLRQLAELADQPLVQMDQTDVERFLYDLSQRRDLGRGDDGWSDSTLQNNENALLGFLSEQVDREWTDAIDRTTVEDTGVDPDTMLDQDDIAALVQGCRYQRDRALIEFLADTGARISLVCSLRVGDVDLAGDRATYTPNDEAIGLKGADRTQYPIIDSRASLRSYLASGHPRPKDDEVALFHLLKGWADDRAGACDPAALRNHLTRIADRAGVDKPVNPHAFRHAAITRMAREGYTRDQIEHRVQWTVDSDMWSNYVHITGAQMNEDIFAEAGVIDTDDEPATRRARCGTCDEPLAPQHRHCPNCGTPADRRRRELVALFKNAVADMLVETDDRQHRQELRRLLRLADENPQAIDDGLFEAAVEYGRGH